jgi:integrase/recombinase XerC
MTPVQPLIDRFLDHLKFERRVSDHTVSAYRIDLLRLQEFAVQRKIQNIARLAPPQARLFAAVKARQTLLKVFRRLVVSASCRVP